MALSSAAVLPHEWPDVPCELRRRRRRCGCCSGAVCCRRRTRYRPVLLFVIMGNVRSLPNEMDELTALTWHQRDYCECSIMVLSETWLTELTPDTDTNLDGFQLRRADRMAESGKRKGGGLAVAVKEQVCSKDIELLAVSIRPYYLFALFVLCISPLC